MICRICGLPSDDPTHRSCLVLEMQQEQFRLEDRTAMSWLNPLVKSNGAVRLDRRHYGKAPSNEELT